MPPTPDLPVMQDLADPASRISRAFIRLSPPAAPFDANGKWEHVYHDISSFNLKQSQGQLTLRHGTEGVLQIENYRNCSNGYRSYTIAAITRADDTWRTPTSWNVTTKVSKTADGPAHLNSGLTKKMRVQEGTLTLRTGRASRALKLPGRYTCKWNLLDTVGRLTKAGPERIAFTLLDEYDEPCPDQLIRFAGTARAKTRTGVVEVRCYQHTGVATVPGVFYVDAAGRVLFYLAGMQLLALASVDGEGTGYLK